MPTSNALVTGPRRSSEPLITAKAIKDLKMGFVGFAVMIIILFHYAWIMKQMLMHRDITKLALIFYFILFGINVFALCYGLLYFAYPYIYKEELEQERVDKQKKQQ